MWFGVHLEGQLDGKTALIRVAGSVLIGAGLCAAAMAGVKDALSRRRGLLLFACAHVVVWLVIWTQQISIWDSGTVNVILRALWGITVILLYLWATSAGEQRCSSSKSLFSTTAPDTTEKLRSQYEQEIRAAARQQERNRLARELHDSIKQQIFVVQTAAATVQARLHTETAGVSDAVERIREAARDAMGEMDAMLDQLRAAPLGNAGLVEVLKKHCEALQARSGATVNFRVGTLPPVQTLPPGAHEAILRVTQEALANVGRHARAQSVSVSLTTGMDAVVLNVTDDGSGFDATQQGRGQGLDNMRVRAEEFGGTFELATSPGRGTAVTFSVPYARAGEPAEYRRQIAASAALVVFSVLPLVWNHMASFLFPVTLMGLVGVIRYTIALRRTQDAARWT